jgi:hypothetical protein
VDKKLDVEIGKLCQRYFPTKKTRPTIHQRPGSATVLTRDNAPKSMAANTKLIFMDP